MRIKKDKSSWRSSGIIRRDFKHDNSVPILGRQGPKKDTKSWCRGKFGVKHDYVDAEKLMYGILFREILKCTRCGKEIVK